MVITSFQVLDKLGGARFFQEIFVMADTTIEMVLEMLFLTISHVNIQFMEKELTQRAYMTDKALLTT